jgi:hypothetical protein
MKGMEKVTIFLNGIRKDLAQFLRIFWWFIFYPYGQMRSIIKTMDESNFKSLVI